MKLNPDCIRAVLFDLEENLIINDELEYPMISLQELIKCDKCKKYKTADIAYTISKLGEAEFINVSMPEWGMNDAIITSISYQGHQFLETVRNDKIYRKVKTILSSVGSFAIPIIQNVAIGVINHQLDRLIPASTLETPKI